jgi:hypothetical protein
MKPTLSDWTVVLVGSWNVAILNPDWLGKSVLGEREFQVELIMEGVRPRMRFQFERVVVIPAVDRLIFASRHPEEKDLLAAEEAAKKVLTLLPVTPITGVGINFGYVESDANPALASLFDVADNYDLGESGFEISSTAITRSLKFEDQLINFRMTQTGGSISFNFNFHKDVSGAQDALKALTDKVISHKRQSEKILAEVYELEIEREAEDGHSPTNETPRTEAKNPAGRAHRTRFTIVDTNTATSGEIPSLNDITITMLGSGRSPR